VRANGPPLAFAPAAARGPSWPRHLRWVGALASAGVTVAVVIALLIVPMPQAYAVAFTMQNAGSQTVATHEIVFPHPGTLDFSWATALNRSVMFTVVGPFEPTPVYSWEGDNGSKMLPVSAGEPYIFSISGTALATVEVSGTLYYTAPLL
jgi:hypothetical protein